MLDAQEMRDTYRLREFSIFRDVGEAHLIGHLQLLCHHTPSSEVMSD